MPKYTRTDCSTQRPSASVPATPNRPIATSGLAFDRWAQGERFGGGELPLGDLGGATQIGVNIVELLPGRQSCPAHWHLREEEHFYVLQGRCVLRVDDERHTMSTGDYVCFPAGTRIAHAFENPYDEPCRVMAIGSRLPDEIAVYPDSGKMKIRALGKIVPLPEASLDYWDGESPDVPLPGTTSTRERERDERAKREEAIDAQVDSELAALKAKLGKP